MTHAHWLLPAGLMAALGNVPALAEQQDGLDPFWRGATVYFMMTDRFANGDPTNDHVIAARKGDGSVLRNFMGGDIHGVTDKINSGYFDALGVDVLWMTPLNEQIHGAWIEDWGTSYSFHGYWPKDWTAIDPNYGTEADMQAMIEAAHKHGMRVLADVVMNHTGPKTEVDPAWPADWIRDGAPCTWADYDQTVRCPIAGSLTDVRTEATKPVALPQFLTDKWRAEGRLDQEMAELDAFFVRTGLQRTPRNYITKWLVDWVQDYGIDGFRVDTAKHVEAEAWAKVKTEAERAFADWKSRNPDKKLDDKPFFMIGEVFNWGVDGFKNAVPGGRAYDFGDVQVDFFDFGFDGLINMGFATHAAAGYEALFSQYSEALNDGPLKGVGILNYTVSHDDPEPYDQARKHPYETANKLMLAPGAAQIYYGDETNRPLLINGAFGDATLRSFMNWEALDTDAGQKLLGHWRKLGQFRKAHRAVGAGRHQMLGAAPYLFSRTLEGGDAVLVALDAPKGALSLPVHGTFADGTRLHDYYSGETVTVKDGAVALQGSQGVVLLGQP